MALEGELPRKSPVSTSLSTTLLHVFLAFPISLFSTIVVIFLSLHLHPDPLYPFPLFLLPRAFVLLLKSLATRLPGDESPPVSPRRQAPMLSTFWRLSVCIHSRVPFVSWCAVCALSQSCVLRYSRSAVNTALEYIWCCPQRMPIVSSKFPNAC